MSARKRGLRGRRGEAAGGQRKAGPTRTPTRSSDAPTGPTRSGVSYVRNRKNMDGGVGFHSTGGAEAARDQSYPLTIGMEGATEG